MFAKGQPEHGAHLADVLENLVALHGAETIAAVMVEPVAGSTGVLVPPKGYLERLRALCDKHGILLIFDEVITGFGRIGANLIVFFHGGGQGNDIYTPIRFSNGGTVWANPENQAKYPCHVLAPRNASDDASIRKVKEVIDQMIADGKVDPNRIYVTGFSMGRRIYMDIPYKFP